MKAQASELANVADLIVSWIDDKQNPRGKFNQYKRVAGNGYELHKLLMTAAARLYLDVNRPLDIANISRQLFEPSNWLLRAQLFFEVMAELGHRKVSVGVKSDESDEDESAQMRFDERDPFGYDEETA